jgi:Ornithine cyclodeaminase/mu-crystallin family
MASCIEACERAFAAYSGGRAELPDVIHLDVPESSGEVHVKAGHLHGHSLYAVKVASGFYGIDPPSIDGMVLVFDARTGAPVALLLDGGFLTDLRTGAAGGVAARHLAPETIEKIAVIGTGAQARYQLDALAIVRPGFERVTVWGRNRDHAEACVEDLRKRPALPDDCLFGTADTVQEAVEGADLVITCTASREPLIRAAWLTAGAPRHRRRGGRPGQARTRARASGGRGPPRRGQSDPVRPDQRAASRDRGRPHGRLARRRAGRDLHRRKTRTDLGRAAHRVRSDRCRRAGRGGGDDGDGARRWERRGDRPLGIASRTIAP